ncbi:valine--tRNA ligase [Patescibacteria group bacterium AH-259-L07]|nr:valine--tRNA ligase [Patescibacteria group bacterium AH-259-L07]
MEKAYEPEKYESKIYQLWEKNNFFNPDKLPGKRKKMYSIAIPPPNITGSLHMGHALNNTIQDIIIRFYRMNGRRALWLPGTDHAGIATQNVVEKELIKTGLTRHKLGREKFISRVWEWRETYGNLILDQLKKLGCSCDWSRTKFTLDKDYNHAVLTAFVHYFKKGYIYRGPRIVNWCPRCATAISDIEIKYREQESKLWHIRYKIKNQKSKIKNTNQNSKISKPKNHIPEYITVATTRPETMLGDTAVAVHPKDERYKDLVGKTVILPIMNREIPIIAHHLIDPEFGTGAVKITPAHDNADAKIGKEKNLEVINVIGPDATMTKDAGKYAGKNVLHAREEIVQELKTLGALKKEEEYSHKLSLCDRCGSTIEPQISTQWFVKMEKLAKPAIRVVKKDKIKIFPKRYKKIYCNWLENIEDWCISRQLWWGHRLPVWFCENQTGTNSKFQNPNDKQIPNSKKIRNSKLEIRNSSAEQFIVSIERPKQCPFCKHCDMEQSADVLDTWFSSALWPFATLGWPQRTKDLKTYYPTSFLSTAPEILYLWVARMVFSSLEFLNKIPFHEVYLHATVLNIEGRRMSKSLGTGLDPLELIEKYGADATRFGLIYQTTRDQQAFRFDERALIASRNFINKLWNINRFAQMQSANIKMQNDNTKLKIKKLLKPITLSDKWILSRLNSVIGSVTERIKNYELGEAAQELYDFTWHEFADWYLEISKLQMSPPAVIPHEVRNDKGDGPSKESQNTIHILNYTLTTLLKLLHPFIPFVTEQIYLDTECLSTEYLSKNNKLLIIAPWPRANKKLVNKKSEQEFIAVKDLVTEIRNWKAGKKIPLKQQVKYKSKSKKILAQKEYKNLVEKLANVALTI